MAQPVTEKAPLDRNDLEGLELDTRAKDEKEKHLDTYVTSPMSAATGAFNWGDEKSMLARKGVQDLRPLRVPPSIHDNRSPVSPSERRCSGSDGIEAVVPPTRSRVQRICGLRRRNFFIMYGTILGILILAAVIGGVIGGTRRNPSATTSSSSPTSGQLLPSELSNANSSINANLPPSDIMVGSPIVPVGYTSTAPQQQGYRLYYQGADGQIKQVIYSGLQGGWAPPQPIFTDAMNNTGLAAITYWNQTASHQQMSIFYVEANGLFAEKRNFGDIFDLGNHTFDKQSIEAVGVITPSAGSPGNPEPTNNWDSYRMTATYSENFFGGPQGRLFIHQNSLNGSFVQEWVWNQTADHWTLGHQLHDPLPGSHLAATVDESSKTLRLYYATANLTLQEKTLNISQPDAAYEQGITIPKLLTASDSDIATISTPDATFLYCYTNSAIYEIAVTGPHVSSPVALSFVVSPNITVNGTQSSIYQPLGAVLGATENRAEIFWAEQVVGATSGYGALMTKSRDLTGSSWNTTNPLVIPLSPD